MTDQQTLKLSPIFNRCLLDLEAIGNFDFLSGDREQAMQVLMDTVDAAVDVVNNSTMESIDVEISRLEDRVVEAAVADRLAENHGEGSYKDIDKLVATRAKFRKAVDALIAARKKAERFRGVTSGAGEGQSE